MFKHCLRTSYIVCLLLFAVTATAQQAGMITGTIRDVEGPVAFGSILLKGTQWGAISDERGAFRIENIPPGTYEVQASAVGYRSVTRKVLIEQDPVTINFHLESNINALDEVVITGTMKEVSRAATPVPVEIFTPAFFKANPSPTLFESLSLINGVRPQINCNVCNTGDIRINGMQGPYTAVLIDGMPIVSSLSTVYGLNGIPNSLIERVEVVKGPASSLYGSEAMAGIINIITKDPAKAPVIALDLFGTSWQEYNMDFSAKSKLSDRVTMLTGINYFNYQARADHNDDGFTDMALAKRISVFNKLNFNRKDKKPTSFAVRYVHEDRWGGEMNWSKRWRGSDSVYGESIYTNRWELIGQYQLPVKPTIFISGSFNWHDQNSFYGNTSYQAYQRVYFLQSYWTQKFGSHDILSGITYRNTVYDDNTPGTSNQTTGNAPQVTRLPGIFIQDEIDLSSIQKLLLGVRYDYHAVHGNILSPRVAYKLTLKEDHVLRASMGTGFRVVNLFTEDHAALTGSRQVEILETLEPERSVSGILNYHTHHNLPILFGEWDVTAFYTYFTNRIIGDFDSDPEKIIYSNLIGHAVTQGISVSGEYSFNVPLRIMSAVTYMDVYQVEDNQRKPLIQAPKWSGNFTASYTLPGPLITIDLTGQWTGSMRLPVFPNDIRPEYSPAYAIVNLQVLKKFNSQFEVYGGVKNLLNFLPKDPLLRPNDPFDKNINDPVNNPNGYTFDTSYNYAPLQGIRGFLGLRFKL